MGIDSRRKCEKLIVQGRVKVNGTQITKLGMEINPDVDRILVDNKVVEQNVQRVHVLLNKPSGYLCTYRPFWQTNYL